MQHFKNTENIFYNQLKKDRKKNSQGDPILATGNSIPEDEYKDRKKASISAKIKNVYEKAISENHIKENGQTYVTKGGEEIRFKSLFTHDAGTLDNSTRTGTLRKKAYNLQSGFNRLDNLQEGEFACIENKYVQTGMFDFTSRGNSKINSADDVAFIFRKLESQAVEHIFAVYVDKNKNPVVQWLSMGGTASAVMDIKLCADAAERFKAKEIYFVHNHPSGNLEESGEDRNVLKKLTNAFAVFGISVYGIIINLNSGHYSVFDTNEVNFQTHIQDNLPDQYKVPVLSFSERAFLGSPLNTRIRTSKDVAQFLSQQRFSLGDKSGYLLLDTAHHIVGNFFATQKELKQATKEAALLASRYGAGKMITYTNTDHAEGDGYYWHLKNNLEDFNITLLDVIKVEPSQFVAETYNHYISLADEGWNINLEAQEKRIPYKKALPRQKHNTGQSHTNETSRMTARDEILLKSSNLSLANGRGMTRLSSAPTDLELKVLKGIVHSEYQDFGIDDLRIINSPVWSFSVTNETKQLAGALGSCVKKGWASCSTDIGDKGNEACCWLTEAGRNVILQKNIKLEQAINLIIGQLRLFTNITDTLGKHRTFTTLVRDGTYEIGITEFDSKGVTETGIEIPATTYEEAKKITDEVSGTLFLQNTTPDNLKIAASTMGEQNKVREEAENYIPGIDTYNINEIQNNYSSLLKQNAMEQKNFDYLNNQLFYHGFGNELSEALKESISSGKESFELNVTKSFWSPEDFSNPGETAHNKNDVAYTLHFSKGNEGDIYFLNSYTAQLPYKEQAENTFYFNGGKSFTAKEAYNMLEGRAVYKEMINQTGERYHAWVQLGNPDENRKRKMVMYHDKYGFNIEEALDNLALVKHTPEEKERLIASLKKGNIQTILLKSDNDKPELRFIVANPKGWNIDIYNNQGIRVGQAKGGQEMSQSNKIQGDTLSENIQSYVSIKR